MAKLTEEQVSRLRNIAAHGPLRRLRIDDTLEEFIEQYDDMNAVWMKEGVRVFDDFGRFILND